MLQDKLFAKSLCFLCNTNLILIGTNSSLSYVNVSKELHGFKETRIRSKEISGRLLHATHKECIQGNIHIFLSSFLIRSFSYIVALATVNVVVCILGIVTHVNQKTTCKENWD